MRFDGIDTPIRPFIQHQILLVIFEVHLDVPSLAILFIDLNRVIEERIAKQGIICPFSIF